MPTNKISEGTPPNPNITLQAISSLTPEKEKLTKERRGRRKEKGRGREGERGRRGKLLDGNEEGKERRE